MTLFHAPNQPDDEAFLVAMWVAAHARGTGVADALVGALLDHAAGLGLRRVTLDVADENGRAAAFYERLGFVRTGQDRRAAALPGGGRVRDGAGPARPHGMLTVNSARSR